MHRKRYFPADLEPHAIHYAALRGQSDRVRDLISAGCNFLQPIQDGETPLHVAIAEGKTIVAKLLIEEMHRDFVRVEEYFVRKYQHDPADKFWLSKHILVAVSETQCRRAKRWEQTHYPTGNHDKLVLVLLRHEVDGENVAVLECKEEKLQFFKLISDFLENGVLSWNSTGMTGNCETLLQLAAYYGNEELTDLLIKLGAKLSFPGVGGRTAFHAACESSQDKIIEFLLGKHIEKFDPTALDDTCQHGLHYILNRKNKKSFQITLEAMIAYRERHCEETASDAFNFIFKLENKDWNYSSIWSQMDMAFWGIPVERALELHQYDLSYQWEEVTVLVDMLTYKIARRFCLSEIRRKPDLLKISTRNGFTPLHALICSNELELIEELYEYRTEVHFIFEREAAIQTLQTLMQNGFMEMLEFVFKKHCEFFQTKASKIEESVISEYCTCNYEAVFGVLVKYVPELAECINSRQIVLHSYWKKNDYDELYENLSNDFPLTLARLRSIGKSLTEYNGKNCLLNDAISENRLTLVTQLLDAGIDFDHLDDEGCHAIHFVRSIQMLHLLVARHPDGHSLVNRKDYKGFTLLHTLCPLTMNGKRELIVELLKYGASIDDKTGEQATVLFYTYEEDLLKFFTIGIESEGFTGISVDIRDHVGDTALHRHLRHLNSHIASSMLRNASSFVSFNNNGDSYLSYLLRFEPDIFNNVFKPILEANPDKTNDMFEREFHESRHRASVLFVEACAQLNIYCIERLLQLDLDFNVRDHNGTTALLALLGSDELPDPTLTRKLLGKEIDVNLRNSDGQNALMLLARNYTRARGKGYDTEMIKLFLERVANINQVDCKGDSLLHYAFRTAETDLIEAILEYNVNLKVVNKRGRLPHEVAPEVISSLFSFLR